MITMLSRLAQPLGVAALVSALAQFPSAAPQFPGGPDGPPPFQGGRGGPGGPFGGEEQKITKQFDKDGDKMLNAQERQAALEFVRTQGGGRGFGRGGRMGFGRGGETTGAPGARLTPADVRPSNAPLYDPATLRTFFLEFEDANWEEQLMAFKQTDIEVPAVLTVDGKKYQDVGIRFRGASSFGGVPEGLKHSINVSIDLAHDGQAVGGYRTLNLLNSHEDPTYLRSVLYYEAARSYLPAPKANFVRVAINGENWGVYVSVQQFNKDFVNESYKTTDGARWKVPGNPGARGGLEYLGEDMSQYKRHYEIKSKDDPKSWADFIKLTKVVNQTPPEQLEAALAPILDIDETLKFLALDIALVNADGYWTRASDYSIYEDPKGTFHILPQDANETFSAGGGMRGPGPGGPGGFGPGGPGGRRGGGPDFGPGRPGMPGGGPGGFGPGGPGGGRGAELDPLSGLNDSTKPLRSKLLAVPALRARYLGYVRDIATNWLDWNRLGPLAEKYQALISAEVKADTRKLNTFEQFESGLAALKSFVERRRTYLLNYKESAAALPLRTVTVRRQRIDRPANA